MASYPSILTPPIILYFMVVFLYIGGVNKCLTQRIMKYNTELHLEINSILNWSDSEGLDIWKSINTQLTIWNMAYLMFNKEKLTKSQRRGWWKFQQQKCWMSPYLYGI
jgi:hypothetical protein